MSEWKRIETAPKKHGRDILVFDPHRQRVVIAWWVNQRGSDDGQWDCHSSGYLVPSHWMPLPAPPESEARDE